MEMHGNITGGKARTSRVQAESQTRTVTEAPVRDAILPTAFSPKLMVSWAQWEPREFPITAAPILLESADRLRRR